MKNIITALIISILGTSAFAQIDPPTGKPVKETKTLLKNGSKIRGFGSLDINVSEKKSANGRSPWRNHLKR